MKTKVEVLNQIISSLTDEDLFALGLQRVTDCCNIPDSSAGSTARAQIHDILKQYGIRPKLTGYTYITDILSICEKEPNKHISITKLYALVAKMHGCSCTNVERCVRNAIETGMAKCPEQYYSLLGNCIGYTKCKPTNAEFIAAIAEFVSLI